MTTKPRTVDNLGIDASIRYAKDKELFEAGFIEESHLVSQKTAIPVAKPYIPSEYDPLFSVGKSLRWASFSPPPEHLAAYARSLFSYQLIPSLGPYEKQDEDEDKLARLEEELDDGDDGKKEDLQAIVSLFKCIRGLNKILATIQMKRAQYQRG